MIDGVIREVVEGDGAGVFVSPGDSRALAQAVRDLAANPERRREMGRKGRAIVKERFDRKALAEQLVRVIEEMKVELK